MPAPHPVNDSIACEWIEMILAIRLGKTSRYRAGSRPVISFHAGTSTCALKAEP